MVNPLTEGNNLICKKRFVEPGLVIALNGMKGSRSYAKKIDGDFEAHLIALSCSDPPDSFARWSLRSGR